ncbi:hypothetical protein BjapCC829_28650 [Bradyrhizobium barranii]|uniref:Uncharacterized protein n=1 Tax=Bradyrhizobium barranii TaxID=2992140 RepID=A0ABY3QD75_9BRAD|nr:hypothetical protein [Bradyrhizobium japonicum]UFW83912.1 hypothetical protein BjapCC829_28650 [Bradyrhizobium japonicum]
MFELPPFRQCPRCKKETFGTLSVGDNSVTKRCQQCRYSHDEGLPDLDKRVIYLDQFAVSELYKTKSKTRKPGAAHEKFWQDCYAAANRAYLRQQVIFPISNLHADETIVWHSPEELRLAHEMFSGETSLERTEVIAAEQEWQFAEAYIKKQPAPAISFNVDDILTGERNVWLPVFHINVNSNMSIFAPGIRSDRATAEASLQDLADQWAQKKPTFDEVLKHELNAYGPAMRQALVAQIKRNEAAMASNDPSSVLQLSFNLINRYQQLTDLFIKSGTPRNAAFNEVLKFLDWPENHFQPAHRIFAYLFAALAWRISSGQRTAMKASILNDFNAIATYAPFVDAMFVDRQCASLLTQGRLRSEISYRAKIFSMNDPNAFIGYLDDISEQAPPEIVMLSKDLYGAT